MFTGKAQVAWKMDRKTTKERRFAKKFQHAKTFSVAG
jgi:hypothetical protein